MSALFLSTESQSPAAYFIIDCFCKLQQNIHIASLGKYTEALTSIAIIPFCVDDDYLSRHSCKERKYISWKRKEADIRLHIPFLSFVQASPDQRMKMCKDIILESLLVIKEKCEKRGEWFDLDSMLKDVFPD